MDIQTGLIPEGLTVEEERDWLWRNVLLAKQPLIAAPLSPPLPAVVVMPDGKPYEAVATGKRIIELIRFWSHVPLVGRWMMGRLADQLDAVANVIEERAWI